MRVIRWEPLPQSPDGAIDIFTEIPPGTTGEEMFIGFMSGVGQVIRAASKKPVAAELQEQRSLPMLHILDEIEASIAPEPRGAEEQELFIKIVRLQTIASEADRLFSWLPREIEIAFTDHDTFEYMIDY